MCFGDRPRPRPRSRNRIEKCFTKLQISTNRRKKTGNDFVPIFNSGWKQKNPKPLLVPGLKKFGGVLLSHTVAHAVPSALKSLTAVFGMGTGVTSSL